MTGASFGSDNHAGVHPDVLAAIVEANGGYATAYGDDPVTAKATALLDAWLASQPRAALRLLGVGVSELAPAAQLELFTAPQTARNRELDAAVDRIRERFGKVALTRASSLEQPAAQPRDPDG